jgi:hypothetical protein
VVLSREWLGGVGEQYIGPDARNCATARGLERKREGIREHREEEGNKKKIRRGTGGRGTHHASASRGNRAHDHPVKSSFVN